ncbi:MAG TPA: biotin/lipoyl-binding protein, partial [Pyrinomonadaceae bacterium]|nr:biotin/lipoyl-binding protein [Pyrinomonadaceae bacterium]
MSSSFLSRKVHAPALMCVLLAVTLLGAACGRNESRATAKENTNTREETRETEASSPAIAVTTATAVAREVPSYIQATGSLVADETSDVASQTSGQVVSTPVGVGAFVRQGAVIARLNDRDARLRLQQAQAGVQQAIAGVRQAEARLGLRP